MNAILTDILQISWVVVLILLVWRLPEIIRSFKSEQKLHEKKNIFFQEYNVFVRVVCFVSLVFGGILLAILAGMVLMINDFSGSSPWVLVFIAFVLLKIAAKIWDTF